MAHERRANPFQALYLTEALVDPELYWHLFSPTIITGEAESLFRIGNVVLLGSNGTGKSMLLRLFSPNVQAAYLRRKIELPIPKENRLLLGVGINLVHAGFGALGRRAPVGRTAASSMPEVDRRILWPLMMGDYLNYSIVAELLATLSFLGQHEGTDLARALGAKVDKERLDSFAFWLARHDCWFGALRSIADFHALNKAVQSRILEYRAFVNWNTEHLPREVVETKTEVGRPIAACRLGLADCGILAPDVPLMVAIDQYESLLHMDFASASTSNSIGTEFCRAVNSLLSMRDPTVSYKVGVRPYGWSVERRPLGTDAQLELGRDYQFVNLDEVLRRKENTGSWIFPKFADDVASRRLAGARGGPQEQYTAWFEKHLEELSPEAELEKYCAGDATRLLPQSKDWPDDWQALIKRIFQEDKKFEAKLAETWINQTLGKGGPLPAVPEQPNERPWRREWWQKERREALKTQIASSCRQRRVYGGWKAIMTLSASNVLVFLSLCREIWDINERSRSKQPGNEDREDDGIISSEFQSQAIRLVAESWLKKLTEFPGGSERQSFVMRLGIGVRKGILADKGLVYPGHNGFSLLLEEYESKEGVRVRAFLDNASDFGALIASPHTTKEQDRRPRKKWYMFPLLCANFEIPAIRTKEPYYAQLSEVSHWLSDDHPEIEFRGVRELNRRKGKGKQDGQGRLF